MWAEWGVGRRIRADPGGRGAWERWAPRAGDLCQSEPTYPFCPLGLEVANELVQVQGSHWCRGAFGYIKENVFPFPSQASQQNPPHPCFGLAAHYGREKHRIGLLDAEDAPPAPPGKRLGRRGWGNPLLGTLGLFCLTK